MAEAITEHLQSLRSELLSSGQSGSVTWLHQLAGASLRSNQVLQTGQAQSTAQQRRIKADQTLHTAAEAGAILSQHARMNHH